MFQQDYNFIYYLDADNINLKKLSSKVRLELTNNYAYSSEYDLVITSLGKIYTDDPIQVVTEFLYSLEEALEKKLFIIAMAEKRDTGDYLLFCPYIVLLTELIARELGEVIINLGGKVNLSNNNSVREVANEITANLFFSTPIKSGLLNANQFDGLIILDIPLRNELIKRIAPSIEKKQEELSAINNLGLQKVSESFQPSVWKQRLEAFGIGILGSIIATGIVEIITRIVVSTPFGSPSLGEVSLKGTELGKLFIKHGKLIDSPVTAKEVALELKITENQAIAILNGIDAFEKVDQRDRSFKVNSLRFVLPVASLIHTSTEKLVSGGLFTNEINNVFGPLKYSYSQETPQIPRMDNLGKIVSYCEENELYPDDQALKQLIENYLKLY